MKGKVQGRYRASSRLDLSSGFDRGLIYLFFLSTLCCGIAVVVLFRTGVIEDLVTVLPVFTASFAVVGLAAYLDVGRWQYLLALLALATMLVLAGLQLVYAAFIVYAILGGFGVVGLVVALQKRYFYAVISRIEALGLKERPDWRDRLISYVFNIREDTDTRNITMEHNLSRNGFPLREMAEMMGLGFMLGVFLWIYLSLNPALLSDYSLSQILLVMFLISMYIPLLVLPWAIFKSLDVRISSEFRDFRLFGGVVTTLQKTVLPVAAVLIYAVSAVNRLGLDTVLGYIATSAAFNLLVVGATTMIYYSFFEKALVSGIVAKWRVFRPMPILVELREREDRRREKELPGMPKRVYEESMEMEFTPYR
ncbi:MAG: hypothetical protein AB7E27_01135 [Candidatus Methanomethylophilaceae archaeon]